MKKQEQVLGSFGSFYGKQMGQGRTFFINFWESVGFIYLAQHFLKTSFKMKMNLREGFGAFFFFFIVLPLMVS